MLLYIHFPFCPQICEYCKYSGEVFRSSEIIRKYIDAVRREIFSLEEDFSKQPLKAVWVGGGIPARLADDELAELFEDMRAVSWIQNDTEITWKAYPGLFSANTIECAQRVGVTRFQIDYASGNRFENTALGRTVIEKDLESMDLFFGGGTIDRCYDIIAGLPGQTQTSLLRTLERICSHGAVHVTLRTFAVEAGTAYALRHHRQEDQDQVSLRRHLPDAQSTQQLRQTADRWLKAKGFEEYLPGQYALNAHRSIYLLCEKEKEDLIGVGIHARSRLGDVFCRNTGDLNAYIKGSPDPGLIIAQMAKIQ